MGENMDQEVPLSFEEWKERSGLKYNDKLGDFMMRQYKEDYKVSWEEMLKREYQEYLSDFNGSWLL